MIRVTFSASFWAIILLTLLSHRVAGQDGPGPVGLTYGIYKTIPETNFPAIDTASNDQRPYPSEKISSATIAYNFKTDFVPDRDGTWKTISAGVDSWFLKLKSRDAYGLALVFSGIRLLPGETMYVYNQHGMRGPYTERNLRASGILPLDFLRGDEIMIEYNVPAGNKHRRAFVVETVSHAYRDIFSRQTDHSEKKAAARFSDYCYLCFQDEAIANERRAVVKLVVHYENSTKVCTGTLVNNTAMDHTPYILTAEHCVSNQSEADRTIFSFGYEDERCAGETRYDLELQGAHHRASLPENDFSLLELYDKPPIEFRPYYAGWDISDEYLSGVTSIHHPQGGPKRVSVSNGTVRTSTLEDGASRAPNGFWKVGRWDIGATEGGSSGASLLNKNHHVIGTLSGGSSKCEAPYNDYFEKISASWMASSEPDRQLKHWLDPTESGAKRLDGSDPFEGIHPVCNTMTNIGEDEQQILAPYTNGVGYFSGYNSDGTASYAEKFTSDESAMLTSVWLNVGSVNKSSPGGLIVSVHSSVDGIPGATLSNSYIPYYRLKPDTLNYIGFYPFVNLAGDFFVSYTLSYSPDDLFALKQSDWRNALTNTAFVKLSSGWVPMSTIAPDGAGCSLGMKITLCKDIPVEPPTGETRISFYPNPTTSVLIVKLLDLPNEGLTLEVHDLQGRAHTVPYSAFENHVTVTTADLHPGLYILRLFASGSVHQARFVKP
jgi:hypothetical protein